MNTRRPRNNAFNFTAWRINLFWRRCPGKWLNQHSGSVGWIFLTWGMQRKLKGLVLEKLGFGNQPYLVYQHRDARHPHIYIATTNIEADGKRIDLHLGAKGRKDEKLNYRTALTYIITGLLIYFFSYLSLLVKIKITQPVLFFMMLASTGFLLVLSWGRCPELFKANSKICQ